MITDHEFLTDVADLNRKYSDNNDFLVLKGQEITQTVVDPSHPGGSRHLHVNGINIDRAIMPVGHPDMPRGIAAGQLYERNVAAVRAAGGIPQINHPNLQWSVRLEDLTPVSTPFLLEVWNAFPTSNNLGGSDDAGHASPSSEALWDALLSKGKTVWGVASDDAHEYRKPDDRESPAPGKAWIVLQAPCLTVPAITDALRAGRFYASTGVCLETYSVNRTGISIRIAPRAEWSTALKPSTRYLTRFVGANGRVLAEVAGLSPLYRFHRNQQYVRASILDSDGRRAWTQPVFLDDRSSSTTREQVPRNPDADCPDSRVAAQ